MSRNDHLHTSIEQAEANILAAMRAGGATTPGRGLLMSSIGYAAFPGYRFKNPQGAALAVARIARSMVTRNLLLRGSRGLFLNPATPTGDKT